MLQNMKQYISLAIIKLLTKSELVLVQWRIEAHIPDHLQPYLKYM